MEQSKIQTLTEAAEILRELGKTSKQNRIAVPARKAVVFINRVTDGFEALGGVDAEPEPEPVEEAKVWAEPETDEE